MEKRSQPFLVASTDSEDAGCTRNQVGFIATGVLAPTPDGRFVGALGAPEVIHLRTATAKHQGSESDAHLLSRLKLAVDSIRDYAIFLLSPQGLVETWNTGAEALKGYEPEEIIGQPIARFYTPEDADAGLPSRLLEEAAQEGRVESEGWRVRKDGSRFWADVVITAVREPCGKLVGFTKVTRDLTERMRLEEERLRRGQAEEALRLRDQFLSIASHKLRTPLTVLQLQLEGIELGLADADPRLRKRLERALRSGERMAELVEALLDVSRIATGKLELQRAPRDLGQLIEEVVDRFEPAAQAAGCCLVTSFEPDLWGRWDRLRIEQVVTNLLSNATKFASGRPIHVKIRREAGDAVIVVEDRGPGIPEGEQDRIFERFSRASSARHFGGMGLGLYVSRQIIELHRGAIAASNCAEGGARFVIRLPLDESARQECNGEF